MHAISVTSQAAAGSARLPRETSIAYVCYDCTRGASHNDNIVEHLKISSRETNYPPPPLNCIQRTKTRVPYNSVSQRVIKPLHHWTPWLLSSLYKLLCCSLWFYVTFCIYLSIFCVIPGFLCCCFSLVLSLWKTIFHRPGLWHITSIAQTWLWEPW